MHEARHGEVQQAWLRASQQSHVIKLRKCRGRPCWAVRSQPCSIFCPASRCFFWPKQKMDGKVVQSRNPRARLTLSDALCDTSQGFVTAHSRQGTVCNLQLRMLLELLEGMEQRVTVTRRTPVCHQITARL